MKRTLGDRLEKIEAKVGKASGRVYMTHTFDNAEIGADALRKMGIVLGENDTHFHVNFVSSPHAKATS